MSSKAMQGMHGPGFRPHTRHPLHRIGRGFNSPARRKPSHDLDCSGGGAVRTSKSQCKKDARSRKRGARGESDSSSRRVGEESDGSRRLTRVCRTAPSVLVRPSANSASPPRNPYLSDSEPRRWIFIKKPALSAKTLQLGPFDPVFGCGREVSSSCSGRLRVRV